MTLDRKQYLPIEIQLSWQIFSFFWMFLFYLGRASPHPSAFNLDKLNPIIL